MKKVLVALSSNSIAARECLIGVFQFANAGHAWNIQLLENVEAITPKMIKDAEFNGTDGIITGLSKATDGYNALIRSSIPMVLNNYPNEQPPPSRGRHIILIHNDDVLIGRSGAKFLRDKGAFNSFGFVPTRSKTYWSTFRRRGFRLELSRWKISPLSYRWDRCELDRWLVALPKPAAVMAASDNIAVSVIETCRRMKLSVPEQIAVLGVDNDELYCNSSRPTLSSIHPDHVEMGRKAAEELDRIMHGKKVSQAPIYIPPIGVVERGSTHAIPPAGFLIRSATDFIRRNFQSGITVKDVVKHIGASDRLVRLRFKEVLGRSIRDTLLDIRLEAAKEALRNSSEPISRIARNCGFSSLCHFSHFFTGLTGESPTSWRKRNRKDYSRPSGRRCQ